MRVLFVCTGNICRSPTAEGVARTVFERAGVAADFDSAGTEGYHVGEAPDPRTQRAATRRGYDLARQRARRVEQADFTRFDLILAADAGHLAWLKRKCPAQHQGKLALALDCVAGREGEEVPDPYYGGEAGFEHVLDLCEDIAHGLLARIGPQR